MSYPLSSREVTTSAEVVQAVTANDFLKMSAAVNAKKLLGFLTFRRPSVWRVQRTEGSTP